MSNDKTNQRIANQWLTPQGLREDMTYSIVDGGTRLAFLDDRGEVHVNPSLNREELHRTIKRAIKAHTEEVSALKAIYRQAQAPRWKLEVVCPESTNADVWYFTSEADAKKAKAYAIDVIHAERAEIELFNPNPNASEFDAFKAEIRELEGRDNYQDTPGPTSIKFGTPGWVLDTLRGLAVPFLDDDVVDHIEPCLTVLKDYGARTAAYHSGGGNMHALGVIEKDGLSVLFWTGADAVGANKIADAEVDPEQAWQDIQHEDEETSSLLAEIVAS